MTVICKLQPFRTRSKQTNITHATSWFDGWYSTVNYRWPYLACHVAGDDGVRSWQSVCSFLFPFRFGKALYWVRLSRIDDANEEDSRYCYCWRAVKSSVARKGGRSSSCSEWGLKKSRRCWSADFPCSGKNELSLFPGLRAGGVHTMFATPPSQISAFLVFM